MSSAMDRATRLRARAEAIAEEVRPAPPCWPPTPVRPWPPGLRRRSWPCGPPRGWRCGSRAVLREAAFLLVFGSRPPIRDALLARLAAR